MSAPVPPPTTAGVDERPDGRGAARDDGPDDAVVLAGRYRLDRRIGQGGMAEVWVATDVQLDRKVAVKWLKPSLATDPVVAERFRREAIAVARLNHPNIVAVHDVFVHDGRQAVVMQLVDGKSLRQLLDGQKRLGPELTIHIGACVAGALDEAHRAGFVHRDVKPGNILVTSDGRVLLTDFGIAKGLDGADDDLTSDNVMMGTAKYLSPEQVRGKKLDGRADLYSLGLVLYECLAGRVPFLGESDADTALARLQRDPTDLARLRPTLPLGLVDLIHRLLARNPAHRPASGADLRAALMTVDTTPPAIDGTPAEPPRRASALPVRDLPDRRSSPAARPAGLGRSPVGPVAPRQPAIPGEPTGSRPVGDADPTPSSAPTPARVLRAPPPARRDRTPPAGTPIHGRPARGLQHSATPSMVVIGLLLLAAAVVAGVLVLSLRSGGEPAVPPATAADGAAGGAADPASGAVDAAEPTGPARIAAVAAWDPDGDNGGENDAQADLALADDRAETAWPTECYSSQYLGGKRGVGLVATLTGPSSGQVAVEVLSAPYQLDVMAAAGDVPPTDLDGWGAPLAPTAYATTPGTVEVDVPDGTEHVLLWLRELGPDEACSSTNPYRGRLGELRFQP